MAYNAAIPLCSDNGIVEEGITQTDQKVTAIVTRNFSQGKTSACMMAKMVSCDVIPVDIGVAEDLNDEKIIRHKISYGTKNYQEVINAGSINQINTSENSIYDLASISKLFRWCT